MTKKILSHLTKFCFSPVCPFSNSRHLHNTYSRSLSDTFEIVSQCVVNLKETPRQFGIYQPYFMVTIHKITYKSLRANKIYVIKTLTRHEWNLFGTSPQNLSPFPGISHECPSSHGKVRAHKELLTSRKSKGTKIFWKDITFSFASQRSTSFHLLKVPR